MIRLSGAVSLLLLAMPVVSQSQLLMPAVAAANVAGNGQDQLGWTVPPFGWQGLRAQIVLSAANFSARGLGGPVDLSRLKLRAATLGGAVTVPGATLNLGTSAQPYQAMSLTYQSQVGADLTTVFQGTIQVAAVPSIGAVGPWFVDIPFSTPFRYDPALGDLLVELIYPSAPMSGSFPAGRNDMYVGSQALGAAIAGSSTFPSATFRLNNAVQILEFDYVPAPGAATAYAYGQGCPSQRASLYELFYAPFDLAGTPAAAQVTRFVRQADGYAVSRTTGTFRTGLNPLGLTDGQSTSVPLPFPFPYVAADGSLQQSNAVDIADDGYLWTNANFSAGSMSPPTAAMFCAGGPRLAAYWTDLDPSLGTIAAGTVGGAFVVSWDQVPELGGSGASVQAQIVLYANGDFDLVHGVASGSLIQPALVGCAPGFGLLASSQDLSALLPTVTSPDVDPLRLLPQNRPVLGAAMVVSLDRVPASATFGAMILSLLRTGLPLDGIGMAGCTQWVGLDASHLLLAPGNGTTFSLGVPNDAGFVGLPIHFQAALFAAGYTQLGVIASNGVATTLGTF